MTALDRFFAKVMKSDGCWLWIGGTNGTTGHGKFWDGYALGYAHRFSWRVHRGPIPAGLIVMHLCDVPACVNPDHLRLGTKLDNARDMAAKGRSHLQTASPQQRSEIAAAMRRSPRWLPSISGDGWRQSHGRTS